MICVVGEWNRNLDIIEVSNIVASENEAKELCAQFCDTKVFMGWYGIKEFKKLIVNEAIMKFAKEFFEILNNIDSKNGFVNILNNINSNNGFVNIFDYLKKNGY